MKLHEIWQRINTLLMGVAFGGMFEVPRYGALLLLMAVSISAILETQRLSDWFGKKQ